MDKLGFQTVIEMKCLGTMCQRVPKGTAVGYGRTYITQEDEWLTVLPVGYCDGYPSWLSNKGHVIRELNGNYEH